MFCLLEWVFLAAIRMTFLEFNRSVPLNETWMVDLNPGFYFFFFFMILQIQASESQEMQLTKPRALEPAFKLESSFAPSIVGCF